MHLLHRAVLMTVLRPHPQNGGVDEGPNDPAIGGAAAAADPYN